MSGPITIKDIARALNTSVSTVSRALKDSPSISLDVRKRIKEYALMHNYQPNTAAANLRTRRSKIIGVILPEFVHFFFSSVLSGIEEVARKRGYSIMLARSDDKYQNEVDSVNSFLENRVCGVIASLAKETQLFDHYQKLLDNHIPVVFFDRICTEIQTERVVVDDYAGSYAAVEYLIKTGCKRIFLYNSPLNLEISKNRRNGYLDAMKKNHIPVDNEMMRICDSREDALAITPEILKMDNRPDAFFAVNDETAAGILTACKEANIKVPDEISICGFTNGAVAISTDPKLTTVEQKGVEVGECAIKILLDKLEGDPNMPRKNRIVRTCLVVRGTTKKL
jgi:DNA-binding LacI/PurR family transcriptional regulator